MRCTRVRLAAQMDLAQMFVVTAEEMDDALKLVAMLEERLCIGAL